MKDRFFDSCSIFCCAIAIGLVLLLPGACSTVSRLETARLIATPDFMHRQEIHAGAFTLIVYERVSEQGGDATLYIEGDGLAWRERNTPSLDPTPVNPVALRLAAGDEGSNVIYMARPCQYSMMINPGTTCPVRYWTSHRFAPEVIDSMNTALNIIKKRHGLSGFNLVGFSGGAAVAVLLAARRDDIKTLRTVAGNLDPALLMKLHNVSPLSGSLNPRDVAPKVIHIPQHHFIGGKDKIITLPVYQSFREAAGNTACISYSIRENAAHGSGWEEAWPELLKAPLDCSTAP